MSTHAYEVVAYNYAHDSANKIHDDTVAARYGFKGGLVPGVADYAYLSRAVFDAWGAPWMHGGFMEAKFIKPVYHGEVARAEAAAGEDPDRLTLSLLNPEGVLCAVGTARRESGETPPLAADYPRSERLAPADLPEPTVETFPAGRPLGTVEVPYETAAARETEASLFVETLDPAAGDLWHPALCLHYANEAVKANVRLDAWVHTASRVFYFDHPRDGETVTLSGTVTRTYLKRGHVMTELDLGVFTDSDRALARIDHTAIIRLAQG